MTETTTCFCGAEVTGPNRDTLAVTYHRHFSTTHPAMGVTLTGVRNYLDAGDRVTVSTQRLPSIGEVTIRSLSPELIDDFLEFFDHRAFAGNLAWAACYCIYHHLGGPLAEGWLDRRWQENRKDMIDLIRSGGVRALLAYADDRVVGWCNASTRTAFAEHRGTGDVADDEVGSIVCFMVAPPYRGHGIARRLLDAAVERLQTEGIAYAEGYPVDEPANAEAAYHGSTEMFLDAGFEVVAEGPVVRRRLG